MVRAAVLGGEDRYEWVDEKRRIRRLDLGFWWVRVVWIERGDWALD